MSDQTAEYLRGMEERSRKHWAEVERRREESIAECGGAAAWKRRVVARKLLKVVDGIAMAVCAIVLLSVVIAVGGGIISGIFDGIKWLFLNAANVPVLAVVGIAGMWLFLRRKSLDEKADPFERRK